MISKISNQQNSPNFNGLVKLKNIAPWTEGGKPNELYQIMKRDVIDRFGIFMSRDDFFTCQKELDDRVIQGLKMIEIKQGEETQRIEFDYQDKQWFEFPGDTIEDKTRNAYDSFTKAV